MNRRSLLQCFSAAGAALLPGISPITSPLQLKELEAVTIKDIKVILTSPNGQHFVIVKVITNQPGLYGIGCASYRERPLAVAVAVEQYLKPLLVGRNCDEIENIWQTSFVSSYVRNGPILNNAISGVDEALWDILGKMCSQPVYKLLGGKCRAAAALYAHASGSDPIEVEDRVRQFMEQGYRHIRVQVASPGFATYGARGKTSDETQRLRPEGVEDSPVFEPRPYMRASLKLFEHLRSKIGFNVELLHDAHERLPAAMAVQFAREVDPFQLFFLEDPLAPEQIEHFRLIRQHSSTPIAMGEIFVSPQEWVPLMSNRLIDFIRVHISHIGGISMGKKIADLGYFFDVLTAWHGPGHVSPVGHAANLALDLSSYNFGIQEQTIFDQKLQDVFPGCPEIKGGYMYSNDKPGLGIDINEELAAQFPFKTPGGSRGNDRRLDGTRIRP
jgi:mannonate dehydratase